jgi:hypothetical protein
LSIVVAGAGLSLSNTKNGGGQNDSSTREEHHDVLWLSKIMRIQSDEEVSAAVRWRIGGRVKV